MQPWTIINEIARKTIVSNIKNRGKTGKFASLPFALGSWPTYQKCFKEQKHAAFDTAKADDAIVTLFNLLISSHNFYGQVASLKEQTDVRHKHDYFVWVSPEVLQYFKLRWDDMIKEAIRSSWDRWITIRQKKVLSFQCRRKRICSKSRSHRHQSRL